MYSQFTQTSRAAHCLVCSGSILGQSHEMCKLAGTISRMSVYRDTKDEDADSDIFNPACGSETDSEYSYIVTPPPSPPKSSSGSSAWSTSERSVRSQLIPPRRKYAQSVLSAASFEIPASGSYHRVNPNYRHLLVITKSPPSEAGTDVSTEPAMSEASAITETGFVRSAASPSPSAKAFGAREGSPGFGSTTSEVMRNHVLATFGGPSDVIGGDPRIVPFCNDTLGRGAEYPYWPASKTDKVVLQRRRPSFREWVEEIYDLHLLGVVDDAVQIIRTTYRDMDRSTTQYIVGLVLFFFAGFFLSPYIHARSRGL